MQEGRDRPFSVCAGDQDRLKALLGIPEFRQQHSNRLESELHREDFVSESVEVAEGFAIGHLAIVAFSRHMNVNQSAMNGRI